MLLSIAEQHKVPFGTLVGAFLAMAEFVAKQPHTERNGNG
jgi:hypothetical protein